MTLNNKLKIGALGCIVLSVFAQFVADFHGLVSMYQNTISIPPNIYLIIGFVGEPILIFSILMISIGFWGAWEKYNIKLARTLSITFVIYSLERCFWAFADINFALTLQKYGASHENIQFAGMLLGISALVAGITAGIVISSQMALFFYKLKNRLGFNACILIISSMIIGIFSKIMTMYTLPLILTVVFLLSMGGKSIGLGLVGISLYQLSKE
ncbi:MAG: hypothetical protein ABSB78_06095 [Bacteroidota bacterium]